MTFPFGFLAGEGLRSVSRSIFTGQGMIYGPGYDCGAALIRMDAVGIVFRVGAHGFMQVDDRDMPCGGYLAHDRDDAVDNHAVTDAEAGAYRRNRQAEVYARV